MRPKIDFKIGADPEFIIQCQDKTIHAGNLLEDLYIKRSKINEVLTLNFRTNEIHSKGGNFGCDGYSLIGEVRPKAGTPEQVVNNLRNIFSDFAQIGSLFTLNTTSNKEPIGGHIHLELPKVDGEYIKPEEKTMNQWQKTLASFYLPLLMGENVKNLEIRKNAGYGRPSDHRISCNGATLECRTPSAEWLTTPKIAHATLAFFATLWHEIHHNPKNILKHKKIIVKSFSQANSLREMVVSGHQVAEYSAKKTKKAMKNFLLYPLFKDEINYLFNFKQVMKDKLNAKYDILTGWGLKTNQVKVNSQNIVTDNNTPTLLSDLTNIMAEVTGTSYNADLNVAVFVKELEKKVEQFAWPLKNKYFLFGLQAGIPNFIAINITNGSRDKMLMGAEMVKTKSDIDYLQNTLNKIYNRVCKNSSNATKIMLGIPWKVRKERNIKSFINAIYQIENNKCPNMKNYSDLTHSQELINDTELPTNQRGKIAKVYLRKIEIKNREQELAEERHLAETERIATNLAKTEILAEQTCNNTSPNVDTLPKNIFYLT